MKLLRPLMFLLTLLIVGNSYAQDLSNEVPVLNSYRIHVTIEGTPERVLFLQGFYGRQSYVIDSANVKKGTAVFSRKNNSIPCGIYAVVNRQGADLMDIILNQDPTFSVSTTQNELAMRRVFVGSPENSTFFLFQQRLAAISNSPAERLTLCNEYLETSPNSFISKFIKANYLPCVTPNLTTSDAQNDTLADYHFLINHYFDNLDLNEPRLLHSPMRFNVDTFFTDILIQNTDTLIQAVSQFLARCTQPYIEHYYHNYLFRLLDTHDPVYDPVLIYLYDQPDKSWIAPENAHHFENKIERLRKIVPGAHIPELIAHDINRKAHSTNDIHKKYTILWFWDPDCDHCMAQTPLLHQFYQEHAQDYDFEVFAIEVNNDPDRWKSFSDKNHLWDWTNLSTSMGEANVDFIEYFDIMTTPVIYLIDNSQNHAIIARQIPLTDIENFLRSVYINRYEK